MEVADQWEQDIFSQEFLTDSLLVAVVNAPPQQILQVLQKKELEADQCLPLLLGLSQSWMTWLKKLSSSLTILS